MLPPELKTPIYHVALCAGCWHEHVCLEILGVMLCGSCDDGVQCGRDEVMYTDVPQGYSYGRQSDEEQRDAHGVYRHP